jgi:bifunctional non-homologous end joining protein LigD
MAFAFSPDAIQRACGSLPALETTSRPAFHSLSKRSPRCRPARFDGEAIVTNSDGLAVFDLIRSHGSKASAVLCAFDLLELDGKDLRREPIEKRKALLAELLRGSKLSIVLNEVYKDGGAIVFREACKLGCEGIVSKRLGSMYRSGRSPHWVKVKNPKAPAVKREAEEDWGR